MHLRALVNELSLGSGGEYDIHLLVHVKNDKLEFWNDEALYEELRNSSVPAEFRGLVTLWSEKQMETVYPGPFKMQKSNRDRKSIHGVWRSSHFPVQWFATQHPEYDYVWNWEMDMRYTGHHYELFDRLGSWTRQQPRKGMWERNAKFYVPYIHGSYDEFSALVQKETAAYNRTAVWGPVKFPEASDGSKLRPANEVLPPRELLRSDQPSAANDDWGVGEDADLITLNPMFDPTKTNWYFAEDVTGYDTHYPIPPIRVSVVAAIRMSRRLLTLMDQETKELHHTMWTETWAPSLALHYGLKAVFAPHPVYFNHEWPMRTLERVFNGAKWGGTGGNASSVFGYHEHNFLGSTWYHSAKFSGELWRRWLGYSENGEGGVKEEQEGGGRICVRPVLLHAIKYETGPLNP